MARRRRYPVASKAHLGPPPAPPRPELLPEAPLFMRLEAVVDEEFRAPKRARMQQLIDAEQAKLAETGGPLCTCGKRMKSKGWKRPGFLTRFGNVIVGGPAYRCEPCKRQERPILKHLGMEGSGRMAGSLPRLVALLAVVVPYQLAPQLLASLLGIQVSTMTAWRCVQRLGEAQDGHIWALAEHHQDPNLELPEVTTAPASVVVGVDGCTLGMQVHAERRQAPKDGQPLPALPKVEEGHFREVKTGVLLLPEERVETSPGRRSVVRRKLVTCIDNADKVFDLMWSMLLTLGWLGPHTVVIVVGDGAPWIWNRAKMFTNRCEILDFWHAVEKAWEFARLRFKDDAAQASTFMSSLTADLRAGNVHGVISMLRELETAFSGELETVSSEQKEKLAELIRYYVTNESRMQYAEYVSKGYGIGSGAVESAHKQVVQARMCQAGMRWSEDGARRLLALRVLLLNGGWSSLDRLAMKRIAA